MTAPEGPTLPPDAAEIDAGYRRTELRATLALARHRWLWTLSADNPDRVSAEAYAAATAADLATVQVQAAAYESWLDAEPGVSFAMSLRAAARTRDDE